MAVMVALLLLLLVLRRIACRRASSASFRLLWFREKSTLFLNRCAAQRTPGGRARAEKERYFDAGVVRLRDSKADGK
jgi:hypothetical protein